MDASPLYEPRSKIEIRAGAESLALSPGLFVGPTISLLRHTRATIHYAQDSSERTYSPMILTNTCFRRRPSRLKGQPLGLVLEDLLPRAKVQTAVTSPPATARR